MRTIQSNLKNHSNYSEEIDRDIVEESIYINHCGYGEKALLMALVHPDKQIIASEADKDKLTIAKYAAEGIVSNLTYTEHLESTIQSKS
jgi:hypothetical protein